MLFSSLAVIIFIRIHKHISYTYKIYFPVIYTHFNRQPLATVFIILLVTAFGACSSTSEMADNQSNDEQSDKEELYWSRVNSAKMDYTEADVKFMTHMIGHHAQALVMSKLVPSRASSEQVKILARRIINGQTDEIESMSRWLRERGEKVPELKMEGINLWINGILSGKMDMAGMLSQEQLEQLKAAKGNRFDHLFLKYMIGHHKGAVLMVNQLLETGRAAQEEAAFKLASGINADQQTEIARMQRMLEALPPADISDAGEVQGQESQNHDHK